MFGTFSRTLSTILTTVFLIQFTVGSGVALAQTNNTWAGNDPFWSNPSNMGGVVGTVNPNDPSFWFNQSSPTDPNNPFPNANDPWGSYAGGWDNSGAFGGTWGGDFMNNSMWGSNPYNMYGDQSYWGYGGSMMMRPTDPWYISAMRPLLSKDYDALVRSYRVTYSAYANEDNDAIADLIIKDKSAWAGKLGAAASAIGPIIEHFWPEDATLFKQNIGSMGMYGGMAIGFMADFGMVIAKETDMLFALQSVYSELSDDMDERASQSVIPLMVVMGGASLDKYIANKLGTVPKPIPVPPEPGPGPLPDPFPPTPVTPPVTPNNPATSAITYSAANAPVVPSQLAKSPTAKYAAKKGAGKATRTTIDVADKSVRGTYRGGKRTAAWTRKKWKSLRSEKLAEAQSLDAQAEDFAEHGALVDDGKGGLVRSKSLVQWMEEKCPACKTFFHDEEWAVNHIKKLPFAVKVVAAASVAYLFDKWSAERLGQWAKRYYKATHQLNVAAAVHQLRENPKAKWVTWLILLRDVFPRMRPLDAKLYAAVLLKELPFTRDHENDELKELLDYYVKFNKDPKNVDPRNPCLRKDLIDEYLADLQFELSDNIEVQLLMIKTIYAAMLMRGYPLPQDKVTIDTVATGLGLIPPKSMRLNQQVKQLMVTHPGDVRVVHMRRYLQTIQRLDLVANQRELARQPGSMLQKPAGYVPARKWRSAQLILEDYNEAGVTDGAAKFLKDVQDHGGLNKPQDMSEMKNAVMKVVNSSASTPTTPPPSKPLQTPDDPFNDWLKNPTANTNSNPSCQYGPVRSTLLNNGGANGFPGAGQTGTNGTTGATGTGSLPTLDNLPTTTNPIPSSGTTGSNAGGNNVTQGNSGTKNSPKKTPKVTSNVPVPPTPQK